MQKVCAGVLIVVALVAGMVTSAEAKKKPAPSCATSTSSKCRPPTKAELASGPANLDTFQACLGLQLMVKLSGYGETPDPVSLANAISDLGRRPTHGPLAPQALLTAATKATTPTAQLVAVNQLWQWCGTHYDTATLP
jgi:hypothetical protein